MDIQDFVKTFRNHPIMFIGTGLSLRYLATSYSWEELLKKVASEFEPNEEYYLDKKTIVIIYSVINGYMNLDLVKDYLHNYPDKRSTEYRKLLCAYDIAAYK